ncbi:MAG TPA: hypothetical protein DCQ50_11785 [Chryseobacterium sp.]|nr:hypothetical protein [Chryseobacterium sp.]
MKKITLLSVTALLCLMKTMLAQSKISVGEHLKPFKLLTVLHKESGIDLPSPDARLTILNFITTSCVSCIQALPKLDSLQHLFGKQLQIVVISPEKQERVKSFFSKNQVARSVSLRVVYADTLLNQMFPHKYVTHVVWLLGNTVVAITGSDYVTAANIDHVLNGNKVNWPVKTDRDDFDYYSSLLVTDPSKAIFNLEHIKNSYSGLLGHIEDVPTRLVTSVSGSDSVLRFINFTIPALYLQTQTSYPFFPPSHILFEVSNPQKLRYDSTSGYFSEWKKKNTWCYEVIFPRNTPTEKIREKIRSDLDLWLNLRGRVESRLTNSYILELQDELSEMAYGDLKKIYADRSAEYEFLNVKSLVVSLNRFMHGTPVFDNTGDKQKSKIFLPQQMIDDSVYLKKALQSQNLRLSPVKKQVEMLIISDPDHSVIH